VSEPVAGVPAADQLKIARLNAFKLHQLPLSETSVVQPEN
jgi:hypothetical protein